LAPKKRKFRKAFKGRVPVRTGGSIKGNNVVIGEFALRAKKPARLSANQLVAARAAIRRRIKTIKGAHVWLRVFPDIPVSSKGNECRMGKGKGPIDFYASRVPVGKIVFEIGGGNMREEVAREALRIGAQKLPIPTEFVIRKKDPLSIACDSKAKELPPVKEAEATETKSDIVEEKLNA
jgi:ribosomal protein L16